MNPRDRRYDQFGNNDQRQTSAEDNIIQDPNDTTYYQNADGNFGSAGTQRPFRDYSQPQDSLWASGERGQGQVMNERDLGGSRFAGQQEFPKNKQGFDNIRVASGTTDNQLPSEQQQALRNDYGINQQPQNIGLGGINDSTGNRTDNQQQAFEQQQALRNDYGITQQQQPYQNTSQRNFGEFDQNPDQQQQAQFTSTRINDNDDFQQGQNTGDQDLNSSFSVPMGGYQQNDEFGANRNVDQTNDDRAWNNEGMGVSSPPPLPPRNQEIDRTTGGYQDVAQDIDNGQKGGYSTQQQQEPDNINDVSNGISNMSISGGDNNLSPGQQDNYLGEDPQQQTRSTTYGTGGLGTPEDANNVTDTTHDTTNVPDTTTTGIHDNENKPSYTEGLTQKLKGTIKYGLGKLLGDQYLQAEGEQQKHAGQQHIEEHKTYVEEREQQREHSDPAAKKW